jgi:hypothetical protein
VPEKSKEELSENATTYERYGVSPHLFFVYVSISRNDKPYAGEEIGIVL